MFKHIINRAIYAVSVCFCLLLSQSCIANSPSKTLVMAWRIAELTTLDPAEIFEFTGLEYAANIYERLVSYDYQDPDKIFGEIASHWTISSDGKKFTFHIKKGKKFSSGNTLTAEDVAYSLRRVIKLNKSPSFILKQFGFDSENVDKNIKVLNTYQVELTTDKAYAPTLLLYCLSTSTGSIIDKEEVESHSQNNDMGHQWLKTHSAGSGPFKLTRWRANEILSLEANQSYTGIKPSLKRIIIRHVPELTTQQLLIEKGDIDIARNLTPADVKSNKSLAIIKAPKGWITYMGMNQKNQFLKIPEVQQAIKWLIDYQGISQSIMRDRSQVHQNIVPKGFFAASSQNPYQHNLKKAKALLKSAGLEKGFHITLDATNLDLAQVIQKNLGMANIDVEIIPGDSKQVLTKYRARNHDLVITVWGTDYHDPHANASTFAYNDDNSDGSNLKTVAWRNNWYDPSINKLTQTAMLEPDTDKRKNLYLEIQNITLQKAPFIVISQNMEVAVLQKNIKGFYLGPSADSTKYQFIKKHPLRS